jgi:tetratricopeptide (TPR) repeat protein
VELAHDIGERADEAEALNNLGDLYLDTAALADAQGRYTPALAIAARIDLALEEGRALEGIGRCLLRLGQDADGTAMPRRALALYERIGSVNAKRVAETLRDKG